jgi:hypothetical protein
MTYRTSNPRQGRAVSHNTGTGSRSRALTRLVCPMDAICCPTWTAGP